MVRQLTELGGKYLILLKEQSELIETGDTELDSTPSIWEVFHAQREHRKQFSPAPSGDETAMSDICSPTVLPQSPGSQQEEPRWKSGKCLDCKSNLGERAGFFRSGRNNKIRTQKTELSSHFKQTQRKQRVFSLSDVLQVGVLVYLFSDFSHRSSSLIWSSWCLFCPIPQETTTTHRAHCFFSGCWRIRWREMV